MIHAFSKAQANVGFLLYWRAQAEPLLSPVMAESTKIWSTTHRGIEVRFWQADDRWFAFAPGQEREIESHSSLRAALQFAFDYINDERRIRPRFAPASGSANVVEPTGPSRSSESKHSPNLQTAASAGPDQTRALHAGAAD